MRAGGFSHQEESLSNHAPRFVSGWPVSRKGRHRGVSLFKNLSLPNARVDVLDQRFGFELVAIAQQIPGLFHGHSQALVEIEFLQADDSVGQRTVCTICHRYYECNLVEPFMEEKIDY